MNFFSQFGMEEQNIIDYYETWKKTNTESIDNYLWFIFNNLLNENKIQSNDVLGFYERNLKIYSAMLDFRRRIEHRKANEILALYNLTKVNIELQNRRNSLHYHFGIIGCKDCDESKELTGTYISITEALENKTIPYSECTRRQGCACGMAMVGKRDSEGNLMFN